MARPADLAPSPSPPSLSNLSGIEQAPAGSSSQQLSWEFLRKQAGQLENEIEHKLTSYSKLASAVGRRSVRDGGAGGGSVSGVPANSSDAMELELDELLNKLSLVVNSMAEVMERPATAATPSSTSMMHMLQRHRDILYDYSKEFKKTKTNVITARNHADLLSSVRDDISLFKSGASSETDYFLSERNRIDNSHFMTDMVIEQAYETRAEFGRQRQALININARIAQVANTFPGINRLIGRIMSRKRRDTVILGVIISMCTIFLFVYMSHA